MNKGSEISGLMDEQKPHVLALTEFGAGSAVNDGELGIDGYSLYRGDHSSGNGGLGKGVAVYVTNSLNHSACPKFGGQEFDCSCWIMIKLSDDKTLLVGVVYRSPNSDDENNERLLAMLRLATTIHCDYLTICGDFNLPRINWNTKQCYDSDGSYSKALLTTIEDIGLFQHALSPTRFRGIQQSCLDLVFTYEDDMIEEVGELPPIGKSDHVCQKWELKLSEVIFRNTDVPRRNFKRANWDSIKSDLREHKTEPSDSTTVMNDKLVAMLNDSKARNIPVCRPRSVKYRLPWMKNAGIKVQRVAKWRCWKTFKRTRLLIDYDAYKHERNRLNDTLRGAKRKYEQRLICDMKTNPNLFHGHCRRSLKTKQGVSNVVDGAGRLTETEEEAAMALNRYYHSVFTKEDNPQPITPEFPPRHKKNWKMSFCQKRRLKRS